MRGLIPSDLYSFQADNCNGVDIGGHGHFLYQSYQFHLNNFSFNYLDSRLEVLKVKCRNYHRSDQEYGCCIFVVRRLPKYNYSSEDSRI